MSRLRSIIYLLPELVRMIFAPRNTVHYPFRPLELPPYYRGRIVIDPELCRGCGACVRDCPSAGLRLRRNGRNDFRLIHYPDRCANCGQCEVSCPTDAIRLVDAYVPPTHDREELVEILVDRHEEPKKRGTSQAHSST